MPIGSGFNVNIPNIPNITNKPKYMENLPVKFSYSDMINNGFVKTTYKNMLDTFGFKQYSTNVVDGEMVSKETDYDCEGIFKKYKSAVNGFGDFEYVVFFETQESNIPKVQRNELLDIEFRVVNPNEHQKNIMNKGGFTKGICCTTRLEEITAISRTKSDFIGKTIFSKTFDLMINKISKSVDKFNISNISKHSEVILLKDNSLIDPKYINLLKKTLETDKTSVLDESNYLRLGEVYRLEGLDLAVVPFGISKGNDIINDKSNFKYIDKDISISDIGVGAQDEFILCIGKTYPNYPPLLGVGKTTSDEYLIQIFGNGKKLYTRKGNKIINIKMLPFQK